MNRPGTLPRGLPQYRRRMLSSLHPLMFHGLHFHPVSPCLLRRKNIQPLNIRIHHSDNRLIIRQIPNYRRYIRTPGQLTGPLPPVTRNNLISLTLIRPDNHRHQNAKLPHTLHHFHHLFIFHNTEWMSLKRMKLSQRHSDHLIFRCFLFYPFRLLLSKQIIKRTELDLIRTTTPHGKAPPLSAPHTLPPRFP